MISIERTLCDRIDIDGPLPHQSRCLRLGIFGGGRIAQTQAIAARLSDRWEIVSGVPSYVTARSQDRASECHIDPTRAHLSFEEMA